MNTLRLVIFAEFFLVALVVPSVTIPGRRILPRLGKVFAVLLVAMLPLLVAVQVWLPGQPLGAVFHAQLLVIAFAAAVAGLAILAGRYWIWGGPVLVSLLAVAVLTTPFWGDVLINLNLPAAAQWLKERTDVDLSSQAVAVRQLLVTCNPLFNVSALLDTFDWVHSHVLYDSYGGYKMTRIGEDFGFSPSGTWQLGLLYAGIGLLTSGVAGLVRPRGRPPDFMVGHEGFC